MASLNRNRINVTLLAYETYFIVCLETQGHLLDDDVMALQRLPDYAATVKKRLSEICHCSHIMDMVSVSALDRLSCLADIYSIEQ